MAHTKLNSRRDFCAARSPRLRAPAVIRAITVLTAVLSSFIGVPALAQCVNGYAPFPGPQSIGWVVTDVGSGVQLKNGSVVPASTGQIHFHEYGTAYGHCDVYTHDCATYITTYYRAVDHLATTMTTDEEHYTKGYNYVLGYVYRNPSLYSTTSPLYQTFDDSSSGTTGPINNFYIYYSGTYNLTVASSINTTICPTMATPTSISTTMTVSYHAPTEYSELLEPGICLQPARAHEFCHSGRHRDRLLL